MEYFDVLDKFGNYTNKVASREECHKEGYWHKVVVVFIISKDNKKVLLQKRSANKKLWPNLWDITAGGHVLTGEFGTDAIIRETFEEIGINLKKEELEFIGAALSENIKENIINRHFNEFYIVHKDILIKDILLQDEEVSDIKWFDKDILLQKIKNNYEDLTTKDGCWEYLKKYLEMIEK